MKFNEYIAESLTGTIYQYSMGKWSKLRSKTIDQAMKETNAREGVHIVSPLNDNDADELLKKNKDIFLFINPYVLDVNRKRVLVILDNKKDAESSHRESRMDI